MFDWTALRVTHELCWDPFVAVKVGQASMPGPGKEGSTGLKDSDMIPALVDSSSDENDSQDEERPVERGQAFVSAMHHQVHERGRAQGN